MGCGASSDAGVTPIPADTRPTQAPTSATRDDDAVAQRFSAPAATPSAPASPADTPASAAPPADKSSAKASDSRGAVAVGYALLGLSKLAAAAPFPGASVAAAILNQCFLIFQAAVTRAEWMDAFMQYLASVRADLDGGREVFRRDDYLGRLAARLADTKGVLEKISKRNRYYAVLMASTDEAALVEERSELEALKASMLASMMIEIKGDSKATREQMDAMAKAQHEAEDNRKRYREQRDARLELERLTAKLKPISFEGDIDREMARYLPGTRRVLLEAAAQWLDTPVPTGAPGMDSFSPSAGSAAALQRVFWIKGGPGMGKSCLSAVLCTENSLDVIVVHFCRHDTRERKDAARAIQSIAFQLARRLPEYRTAVQGVLLRLFGGDGEAAQPSPKELWTTLLVEPLAQAEAAILTRRRAEVEAEAAERAKQAKEAHSSADSPMRPLPTLLPTVTRRYAILIDALDEAGSGSSNDLLDLLSGSVDLLPAWLGVIVTSRPESMIVAKLSKFRPAEFACDSNNREDIQRYLTHFLSPAVQPDQLLAAVDLLLVKCGGLILSASLLLQSHGFFADQLPADWSGRNYASKPLTLAEIEQWPLGLDSFYFTTLQNIRARMEVSDMVKYRDRMLPRDLRTVMQLVAFILAAYEPLTLECLAEMAQLPNWRAVLRRLAPLKSLFPISPAPREGDDDAPAVLSAQSTISVYHKSVKDFFFAEERQDDDDHFIYFCDAQSVHRTVAMRCFERLVAAERGATHTLMDRPAASLVQPVSKPAESASSSLAVVAPIADLLSIVTTLDASIRMHDESRSRALEAAAPSSVVPPLPSPPALRLAELLQQYAPLRPPTATMLLGDLVPVPCHPHPIRLSKQDFEGQLCSGCNKTADHYSHCETCYLDKQRTLVAQQMTLWKNSPNASVLLSSEEAAQEAWKKRHERPTPAHADAVDEKEAASEEEQESHRPLNRYQQAQRTFLLCDDCTAPHKSALQQQRQSELDASQTSLPLPALLPSSFLSYAIRRGCAHGVESGSLMHAAIFMCHLQYIHMRLLFPDEALALQTEFKRVEQLARGMAAEHKKHSTRAQPPEQPNLLGTDSESLWLKQPTDAAQLASPAWREDLVDDRSALVSAWLGEFAYFYSTSAQFLMVDAVTAADIYQMAALLPSLSPITEQAHQLMRVYEQRTVKVAARRAALAKDRHACAAASRTPTSVAAPRGHLHWHSKVESIDRSLLHSFDSGEELEMLLASKRHNGVVVTGSLKDDLVLWNQGADTKLSSARNVAEVMFAANDTRLWVLQQERKQRVPVASAALLVFHVANDGHAGASPDLEFAGQLLTSIALPSGGKKKQVNTLDFVDLREMQIAGGDTIAMIQANLSELPLADSMPDIHLIELPELASVEQRRPSFEHKKRSALCLASLAPGAGSGVTLCVVLPCETRSLCTLGDYAFVITREMEIIVLQFGRQLDDATQRRVVRMQNSMRVPPSSFLGERATMWWQSRQAARRIGNDVRHAAVWFVRGDLGGAELADVPLLRLPALHGEKDEHRLHYAYMGLEKKCDSCEHGNDILKEGQLAWKCLDCGVSRCSECVQGAVEGATPKMREMHARALAHPVARDMHPRIFLSLSSFAAGSAPAPPSRCMELDLTCLADARVPAKLQDFAADAVSFLGTAGDLLSLVVSTDVPGVTRVDCLLLDARSGQLLQRLELGDGFIIREVRMRPDHMQLALLYANWKLRLINLQPHTQKLVSTPLKRLGHAVYCVEYGADGHAGEWLLISGAEDGEIRSWLCDADEQSADVSQEKDDSNFYALSSYTPCKKYLLSYYLVCKRMRVHDGRGPTPLVIRTHQLPPVAGDVNIFCLRTLTPSTPPPAGAASAFLWLQQGEGVPRVVSLPDLQPITPVELLYWFGIDKSTAALAIKTNPEAPFWPVHDAILSYQLIEAQLYARTEVEGTLIARVERVLNVALKQRIHMPVSGHACLQSRRLLSWWSDHSNFNWLAMPSADAMVVVPQWSDSSGSWSATLDGILIYRLSDATVQRHIAHPWSITRMWHDETRGWLWVMSEIGERTHCFAYLLSSGERVLQVALGDKHGLLDGVLLHGPAPLLLGRSLNRVSAYNLLTGRQLLELQLHEGVMHVMLDVERGQLRAPCAESPSTIIVHLSAEAQQRLHCCIASKPPAAASPVHASPLHFAPILPSAPLRYTFRPATLPTPTPQFIHLHCIDKASE